MKANEVLLMLVYMTNEDNEVSAFYIIEEALRVLRRNRSNKYKGLIDCLETISMHSEYIAQKQYEKNELHSIYKYRTIAQFLEQMSCSCDEEMYEHVEAIRAEVRKLNKLIQDIGDINANGNEISAWLDTVPEEAYHPFANDFCG